MKKLFDLNDEHLKIIHDVMGEKNMKSEVGALRNIIEEYGEKKYRIIELQQ